MLKTDAIEIFSSVLNMADSMNITRNAICNWPDDLTLALHDRVLGAAVRTGVYDPLAHAHLVPYKKDKEAA